MDTAIIASTRPYIGKSGIALALIDTAKAAGKNVSYFKPYGTMPTTVGGVHTDLDAAYISQHIGSSVPLDIICPVVESRAFIEDVVAGRITDARFRVRAAYEALSDGVDLVVVEGPSDIFQGRSIELSLSQVAETLDARVLLLAAEDCLGLPDGVLGAADCLASRLAGVLFNDVALSGLDFVNGAVTPFLTPRGITVFGAIPHDTELSSVTVAEVADALSGTVLCAQEHVERSAQSFMVGAMGQDKALRFFQRRPRKIVVTGGDRSDVQLAALETDTRAIVLTGNLPPSPHVLARAEELGVPVILVGLDTLGAVERLEDLFGRMRIHDPVKAARIREMLAAAVDIDALLAAFES